MKKFLTPLIAVAVLAGMGVPAISSASSKAPSMRCHRLDTAERSLQRRGFHIREAGGGIFGILVKADWVVVHQSQRGNTVTLTAGRYC